MSHSLVEVQLKKATNLKLVENIFEPNSFCTIHIFNYQQLNEFINFNVTDWEEMRSLSKLYEWKILLISNIIHESNTPEWDLNLKFKLTNLNFHWLCFQIWDYDSIELSTERISLYIFDFFSKKNEISLQLKEKHFLKEDEELGDESILEIDFHQVEDYEYVKFTCKIFENSNFVDVLFPQFE
jgi:hypothetical protein